MLPSIELVRPSFAARVAFLLGDAQVPRSMRCWPRAAAALASCSRTTNATWSARPLGTPHVCVCMFAFAFGVAILRLHSASGRQMNNMGEVCGKSNTTTRTELLFLLPEVYIIHVNRTVMSIPSSPTCPAVGERRIGNPVHSRRSQLTVHHEEGARPCACR